MNRRAPRILLVAGEASGDIHGAALVRELRRRCPDARVSGIGGTYLRREGMEIFVDTATVATMGLTEILGSAGRLLAAFRRMKRILHEERPDLLILIDYPEFNMMLAKHAKRLGVPVFYYISPQVWAWRRGRIRKIVARVDRLGVIFPFEAELYNEIAPSDTPSARPVAVFVGHPLIESVHPSRSAAETRARHGLDPDRLLLAILPGSRKKEIGLLLRPALEAASRLQAEGWQAVVVLAHTLTEDDLRAALDGAPVGVPVIPGETYDVLHAADAALVKSGTATLETALLGRPMVIMYRVSRLTHAIAKRMIRVDHIGMPNLILDQRIFPECVQDQVTAENLVAAVHEVYGRRDEMQCVLEDLRARLGEPGAAGRAAELALELIA
jgi:lipid-A-disaccharide synthase